MDLNLEFYRSILHLGPKERRQRMQQIPKEEAIRVKILVEREEWEQRLEKQIAGRNIVDLALSNPVEIQNSPSLQRALLGRPCYIWDDSQLVARFTNNEIKSSDSLIHRVAGFSQGVYRPSSKDAWILVYCDVAFVDGDSNTLREIYNTRLREEELQTRAEKAREVARSDEMKLARRNAKWMIPAIDQLSDEQMSDESWDYGDTLHELWKQVSHPPPDWVQHILDTDRSWGLTYYKSREVEERYGHEWEQVWLMLWDSPQPLKDRDERKASWFGIHCQGKLDELMALHTAEWATLPPHEGISEDDAFRRHFKEYRKSLTSPGILQNTFIIIPIDLIPRRPGKDELDPYWVWAYDADWERSVEETTYNGEKYQGRVKIAYYSLTGWFYAARREGVSLRDMWLKAQTHEDKLWICFSKYMEEWDHEPFV